MTKEEALQHMEDRREYEAGEVLSEMINEDNCMDLTGEEWPPDETWEDKARTDAYIDKKYDQHVDDKLTEEADLKRWGISMDIHPLN